MFSLLARSSFQSQLAFRKRLGALGTATSVVERGAILFGAPGNSEQVEEDRAGLLLSANSVFYGLFYEWVEGAALRVC